MRKDILNKLQHIVEDHEKQGENMEDIRLFLDTIKKIGCKNCIWYQDGFCLHNTEDVDSEYFCTSYEVS